MAIPWLEVGAAVQILAPGGIAAFAVKYALNGLGAAIRRIDARSDHNADVLATSAERIARIEAKLEVLPCLHHPLQPSVCRDSGLL